jgi:hypothetical protein
MVSLPRVPELARSSVVAFNESDDDEAAVFKMILIFLAPNSADTKPRFCSTCVKHSLDVFGFFFWYSFSFFLP